MRLRRVQSSKGCDTVATYKTKKEKEPGGSFFLWLLLSFEGEEAGEG